MLQKLKNLLINKIRIWKLAGFDTFSGKSYHMPGMFFSEALVKRAARKQLMQLEKEQPSSASGGQEGIQDQVYIVRPDGSMYRYRLDEKGKKNY